MPTSHLNNKRILITIGDPAGIGPEVTLKAVARLAPELRRRCVLLGDITVVNSMNDLLSLGISVKSSDGLSTFEPSENRIDCVDVAAIGRDSVRHGAPTVATGRAALAYIDAALTILKSGAAAALVTAPVQKSAIADTGTAFVGHTEYLAEKTGTKRFAMMLAGGGLRVTLVTRHIALRDVPGAVTIESISDAVLMTSEALIRDFGIPRPRIAIAGLNPHAGEGGHCGDEEARVIIPAIDRLSRKISGIFGPRPPDTVFHEAAKGAYDAVIAMYHDQGLAPLKLVAFEEGINVTLGLPFVRTSPDHGTAMAIAGKGVADPRSMEAAIRTAAALARVVAL